MKITGIHTYILKVPLGEQRFYSSQCAFPERNSMLVKIETDEGIYGWGEGGQYGPAEPVKCVIDTILAPILKGRDPMDKGILWDEMYQSTRDFGQKGTYIEAISAVDIALWDICGKALGVPVYKLLGGKKRNFVPCYATGCYYRGEDVLDFKTALPKLQKEAESYVEAGFEMLKIKVGLLSVEDDAKRVSAIREAVGESVKLFCDCNHSYNAYTAIRMAKYLEENQVLFMEEPVVPEDFEGYCRVRRATKIAVAGGECEYTAFGFKRYIERGCIDIAQPDICVSGGLTEFQRIAAVAGVYGTAVIPHVWGSGVAIAAALAAIAAMPLFPHTANPVPFQNEPMMEYDRNPNPLRDELLVENFELKDRKVKVPDKEGLGIDIDDKVLEKYRVL